MMCRTIEETYPYRSSIHHGSGVLWPVVVAPYLGLEVDEKLEGWKSEDAGKR
jgi:hypothetical protein